jgi:hypothetical protein
MSLIWQQFSPCVNAPQTRVRARASDLGKLEGAGYRVVLTDEWTETLCIRCLRSWSIKLMVPPNQWPDAAAVEHEGAIGHALKFLPVSPEASVRFGLGPALRIEPTVCSRLNQNGAPNPIATAVMHQPGTVDQPMFGAPFGLPMFQPNGMWVASSSRYGSRMS